MANVVAVETRACRNCGEVMMRWGDIGWQCPNTRCNSRQIPAPKITEMREKTWIEQAVEVTTQVRQKEYDHPLLNFLRIGILWTMWLMEKLQPGEFIHPVDVAWMMAGTKFAREIKTHKDDNPIDNIGYMSCHDRIDQYMREIGYANGAEAFRTMTYGEMSQLLDRLTHES